MRQFEVETIVAFMDKYYPNHPRSEGKLVLVDTYGVFALKEGVKDSQWSKRPWLDKSR